MINYDLSLIKAFAFDVDGVLSGNNVLLADNAQPLRTANVKDGYALHQAVRLGYPMAIITGGKSPAVRQRYEGFGMTDIYDGVSHKLTVFQEWLDKYDLKPEEVIYMGDDIPDLEVMHHCGCPCCPADAAPEVREVAVYVSHCNAGEGCVRDVMEQVLRAHGHWLSTPESYIW